MVTAGRGGVCFHLPPLAGLKLSSCHDKGASEDRWEAHGWRTAEIRANEWNQTGENFVYTHTFVDMNIWDRKKKLAIIFVEVYEWFRDIVCTEIPQI